MTKRLIFAYNANAGFLAGALDSVHKTLSPATYACNLCALTHGMLSMRPQWRRWLESLSMPADFYHRPDFRAAFPELADEQLPLVGVLSEGRLSVILGCDVLAEMKSLDDLLSMLQAKLGSV